MRLKKLELYGFKSFATRTEIVLDDGITGIVGPNGSGKSNIGDAVRWVLGETSAKTLRGASMSDVIFNGTQRRKPLSYCEVSLIFDNADHTLPMDYAEVMVTRRVYRNGEGEYFLNQSACRLKDIVDLFRDTGIGREGYSIIGQGRIDEILSRKSEDRRQVFEEAAGIVRFRARKEEADRKLARTVENADRVADVLEELTRRLGPLEQQSGAARRYLELTGELKGLDLNLFLIRSDRYKQRLAELDAELEGLKVSLAETEAALSEKTRQRDQYQEQITALDSRITEARDRLMAAAEAVHGAERRAQALASRSDNRKENLAALESEQLQTQTRLAQLEELRASSESGAKAANEAVLAAQQALESANAAAEAAEINAARAEQTLNAHKSAMVDAMNRRSDTRDQQTRLMTMKAQMEARLKELGQSEETLQAQRRILQDALASAEALLRQERERKEELDQAHQTAEETQAQLEAELVRLRVEGEKLSASLQEKHSRWKLIREWTQEMEGYSQSVRRAVQYSRDRGLKGVKGVLAQLIRVPARYETAIDMALGAALQNIVTDTEETAKELIDYLKQNRLGRATFLPLSAMRPKLLNSRERDVLAMPGCLGAACDLVACDAAFRPVIENLLGRTVIADDLNHGIAIQRAGGHAFRLVTLDGDVMHSGGSMTGGSVQSRGVNLLGRERELNELTQTLTEGRTQLEAMRQRLTEKQQRQQDQRRQVAEALNALHQQEIAVARETERTAGAQADLTAHDARMAQADEAREQLNASIADIDEQLQLLKDRSARPEDDQAAMEARAETLTQLLQEARTAAAKARDLTLQHTLDLSEKRHALDVISRDSTRYAQDRAQLKQEQSERAERMAHMAEEDKLDQAELSRLGGEHSGLVEAQQTAEQAAEALEAQRVQAQSALREVLSETDTLSAVQTRDSDRQHRSELQRARTENDLKNLQARIWDTWELTYAGAEPYRQTEGFNEREADRRVAQLNSEIKALGSVNVSAVQEYAETKARHDELSAQLSDLRKAEADLRELIDTLLKQMRVTFVDSFTQLQGYFSETFTRLFGGGHAELALTDPDDPLNCGIEVNAQPPGKKLQLLSLLSGGERALTAIAILFAMLKLKPTPFCILDEIEAALDDANIGYYADYLKEYSADTQFIVVTHRKGTMERCNSLYGVAMEEHGVSRMVSVSLKDFEE